MNGRLMTHTTLNSRELALDIIRAAAYTGDTERISQIVADFGNDAEVINDSADFGLTPLLLATLKGHGKIVNLLLTAPAIDVNARVQQGNFKDSTALYLAAAAADSAMLSAIARHPDTQPNIINDRGDFALKLAAIWSPDAVPDLLKMKDIDVNLKDQRGRTTLFNTVLELNAFSNPDKPPAGLEALLSAPNVIVDTTNNEKWTPLMVAVSRKHIPTIKTLLNAGAKASYQIKNGMSVLELTKLGDRENPTQQIIIDLISNAIMQENKAKLADLSNTTLTNNPSVLFNSGASPDNDHTDANALDIKNRAAC